LIAASGDGVPQARQHQIDRVDERPHLGRRPADVDRFQPVDVTRANSAGEHLERCQTQTDAEPHQQRQHWQREQGGAGDPAGHTAHQIAARIGRFEYAHSVAQRGIAQGE
jgi:hypothetical protein